MIVKPIEIARVRVSAAEMLETESPQWGKVAAREVELVPVPIALVAGVSPYVARGQGHGVVRGLRVRMLHNGTELGIRLSWPDETPNREARDLDQFVDAAAVMFPLASGTHPFTMGDAGKPVNLWYWKADREEPFDVIARGYATSQRRPGRASGLVAKAHHESGEWTVILQRALRVSVADTMAFALGANVQLAFAVWEGSNAERSAQKSVSDRFVDARLGE